MADENLTPNSGRTEKESSSDLAAGFLVGGGRFSLLRELGRGGMGVVWLAHDERLMAPVALKFLPRAVRANPAALNDLRQETKKSRMLSHPNIIRIYDLYEAPDEAAFISMEYVDGPTLWLMRSRQPEKRFHWPGLKPLVKQLCAALEYAHGENVIHRDLKSANMLLDDRQRLRLADFGIAARAVISPTGQTGAELTSGTLGYMSPQQVKGGVPCVADDIYSLGATLYELLCGFPPFCENDIAYQVCNVLPAPLDERLADLELENDVPPPVAAMVMACLAKDPDKRPKSASAVMEWIGLTETTVFALPSLPPEPVAVPPTRPPLAPVVETAKPPQKPLSTPLPARQSTTDSHSPMVRNEKATRFFGLLAGALGVGLAAWLAWTHFLSQMPGVGVPGSAAQTNSVQALASRPVADIVSNAVPERSLKGVSVGIELGPVNRENGLHEVTGVDDGVTTPMQIGDKYCRLLASQPRARCYFQIAPGYKTENLVSARIQVEYYANGPGVMQLQYDGVAPRQTLHYTGGGKVNFDGSPNWQTANFHVHRARFRNGERGGADFRLTAAAPELYLRSVTVFFDE